MAAIAVHVWSDVVCPWCYIGKRHLEQALEQFSPSNLGADDRKHAVKLLWHSFELDPSAPTRVDPSKSHAERLAAKYGTSLVGAQTMIERVVQVGRKRNIAFEFDKAQSGNTFAAHQLLHWARTQPSLQQSRLLTYGAQHQLKERLLKGYFTEGAAIGDPEVLVGLARDAELDEEGAYNALRSGTFKEHVRLDEQRAQQLGIGGVPFFLIGRHAVSGAQPPELLLEVLGRAANDLDSNEITKLVEQQDGPTPNQPTGRLQMRKRRGELELLCAPLPRRGLGWVLSSTR